MKLVADLHTHSLASGHAYSTIEEIVGGAAGKGLELVAVTDHGPQMPGGPHYYYFGNLRVVPHNIGGVEILRGVEANIMNDRGGLDLEPWALQKLDVVLAGFHTYCFPSGRTVKEHTRAMINIMADGLVDIIVHPGNPEFQVDAGEIVAAAKTYGVALEINNSSLTGTREGSLMHCDLIARLAAEAGILVSVGSDAHWAGDVGKFDAALGLVERAGIIPENVLNTSVAKVKDFLRQRRKLQPDLTKPDL